MLYGKNAGWPRLLSGWTEQAICLSAPFPVIALARRLPSGCVPTIPLPPCEIIARLPSSANATTVTYAIVGKFPVLLSHADLLVYNTHVDTFVDPW